CARYSDTDSYYYFDYW
nr:immunoglobulin heavy chain junction region [Macaca mulatta]MOX61324.1 immunoglobulin heavy chain junction region [Macaca mulatta]MOX62554.1 immunoglobulin heavy chain junction region [Macaca mulatta]MOX62925.1 immunoglobulin heavy chain junction region [Macaca mulatta]MOX65030.1 immunoglobulin heavy chain junction region [Macaca mulatta]